MSNIDKIREMTMRTPKSAEIENLIDKNYKKIEATMRSFRGEYWARYVVRIDIGAAIGDDGVDSITVDIAVHYDESIKGFRLPLEPATMAAYGASVAEASSLTREHPRDNEVRVLVSHKRGKSLFFVEV